MNSQHAHCHKSNRWIQGKRALGVLTQWGFCVAHHALKTNQFLKKKKCDDYSFAKWREGVITLLILFDSVPSFDASIFTLRNMMKI